MNKADILELTVTHLRSISRQVSPAIQELRGFCDCIRDVDRFIRTSPASSSQDEDHRRLKAFIRHRMRKLLSMGHVTTGERCTSSGSCTDGPNTTGIVFSPGIRADDAEGIIISPGRSSDTTGIIISPGRANDTTGMIISPGIANDTIGTIFSPGRAAEGAETEKPREIQRLILGRIENHSTRNDDFLAASSHAQGIVDLGLGDEENATTSSHTQSLVGRTLCGKGGNHVAISTSGSGSFPTNMYPPFPSFIASSPFNPIEHAPSGSLLRWSRDIFRTKTDTNSRWQIMQGSNSSSKTYEAEKSREETNINDLMWRPW